jgi:L-cysteine/cystine lyase
MTFEEARTQFPVLERLAYLNAGSVGPLARATFETMRRYLEAALQEGRAGKPYVEEMLELRQRLCARIAGLLDVPAENVALTDSTTRGCITVLTGLDLDREDEIVTTDVEHFGVLGPVHASGARVRVARVKDRPADEALDAILAEVSPRTRLVALSHVSWTTGQVLPIAELKERVDAPLLVDGAQSVGAIPVSAAPFDFYTVSGQKWLCGPDPTGALYVADPERLGVAGPTYFSQQSYESDGAFVPKVGAARFNAGWISPASLAALLTAIDTAPEWRFDGGLGAAARCRELLLDAGVDVVTEPDQATLVTFVATGDAEQAAAKAFDEGVVIRDLPGTGWLRASCGYWTSDDDLERLVAAVSS